ncbi:MAG: Dabb family protein [Planctomycetales bacterium]|nr:Dabb family protein [Planctomycetales bacterium]
MPTTPIVFSRLLGLAAMTALLLAVGTATAELKKGDRVVFLGDSITQAGAGPGGYVTLVREALDKDHKDLGVEVIGAGISGNKVPDLEKRLERDVLAKKPTVVVIYIGINDVWHSQSGKGTPKDEYEKGLSNIIQQIQKAGGRVILCTATVIGEKTDGTNSLDKMLDEFCDISRGVARKEKVQLLDLRKAFLAHLKEHNKGNLEQGVLTGDKVHLNAEGNKFVATQMLAALTEAAQTSSEKSAKAGKVLRHCVLVKFKADLTPEQIKESENAFRSLKSKIDVIKDFEWGTDVSVEGKSEGFTHCFMVTFADDKARDTYLPHAAHKEFVSLVGPRIEKVLVVDYWTKE